MWRSIDMKPVIKDIYQNIMNHLEQYGFRIYKGKIWKYNPIIGYVIAIAVDPTPWGTLNEITVSYSTCQEPIQLKEYGRKKIVIPRTYWETCAYLRMYRNVDVFDMGHPNQSVDITMWQQYATLLPCLEEEVFPVLLFDDKNIKTYLRHMETISIMSCKTNFGISGIRWLDLARECLRLNETESALRIIDMNVNLCDHQIHSYKIEPMNLNMEERQKCILKWKATKRMALELAEMIQNKPEELKHQIDENKIISEKTCQEFFTSRYFSLKAVRNL